MFQNLNYKLQRRLSDVLLNQQSHQKYVQRCTLRMLRYPIRLSTTVLCTCHAGVRKRRGGETFYRLSPTVSPAYRVGFRERRRGETV